MRTLHIIMPMAGEGSRFFNEGWTTPKPLILLDEIPLFMRAINSISIKNISIKYSFIVRQEHIDNYEIDNKIKSYIPQANLFSVLKTTRGAVETCLIAEDSIDNSDAVIIMDCDLEFESNDFLEKIKEKLNQSIEDTNGGVLVSFDNDNSRYSYAVINEDGLVIRTAEKEVISNHALCGAYFFSSGKRFKEIAHQLLNESNFDKKEFYVTLLYK